MIIGRKDKQRIKELEVQVKVLQRTLKEADEEIVKLLKKPTVRKIVPKEDMVGFEVIDPSPTDDEARKSYVSTASAFFDMGFRDRLKYMAAIQKDYIAKFPLERREEDFYRASLNVIYLLLEWGEELEVERAGYAQGDKEVNAFDEAEEEKIDRLKDKVK